MHYHDKYIHTTPEEFRETIVRALTKMPPVSEAEAAIHHFIGRWPEYTGGWLLMHCGIFRRHSTDAEHSKISLFIRIDNYSSWMSIAVKGLKKQDVPGFNDWFIRRRQFICFEFLEKVIKPQ